MFSQVVLKCPVSSSAFPWLDAGDARGHTGSVREGGPVPGCPYPTQVWEKGEDRQMGSQDLCSWACGPRVPILLIQENCSLSYVHDIVGFCLQRGCRNARKPHSAGGDHLPLLLTAPNFWEWCWAPTHRQLKSSPACVHSPPSHTDFKNAGARMKTHVPLRMRGKGTHPHSHMGIWKSRGLRQVRQHT